MLSTPIKTDFFNKTIHHVPVKGADGAVFIDQLDESPRNIISKLHRGVRMHARGHSAPQVILQLDALFCDGLLLAVQRSNGCDAAVFIVLIVRTAAVWVTDAFNPLLLVTLITGDFTIGQLNAD